MRAMLIGHWGFTRGACALLLAILCMGIGAFATVALSSAGWVLGQPPAAAPVAPARLQVLQAHSFELLNGTGEVIAALRSHEESGAPILALYDAKGNPRGGIALNKDGVPVLSMQDSEFRQRLRIYVGEDGAGAVELLGPDDECQVSVRAGATPEVFMKHHKGSVSWGWSPGLQGFVGRLVGGEGKSSVSISAPLVGDPKIRIQDSSGKEYVVRPLLISDAAEPAGDGATKSK